MVAIALLLRRDCVPYLQIPQELLRGTPEDYATLDARPNVRKSSALIRRVFQQPGITTGMLGTVLQRILTQHRDPNEQNTLICDILRFVAMTKSTASLPLIAVSIDNDAVTQAVLSFMRHLVENIPEKLRGQVISAHHCGNPACPLHQVSPTSTPDAADKLN